MNLVQVLRGLWRPSGMRMAWNHARLLQCEASSYPARCLHLLLNLLPWMMPFHIYVVSVCDCFVCLANLLCVLSLCVVQSRETNNEGLFLPERRRFKQDVPPRHVLCTLLFVILNPGGLMSHHPTDENRRLALWRPKL